MSTPTKIQLAQLQEELTHVEQQVVEEARIAEEARIGGKKREAERIEAEKVEFCKWEDVHIDFCNANAKVQREARAKARKEVVQKVELEKEEGSKKHGWDEPFEITGL